MTLGTLGTDWRWVEAPVARGEDHLRLVHDDYAPSLVALVGPPAEGVFPVEFLVADDGTDATVARVLAKVRASLEMYLLEVGRPNPWAYAHYHCGTLANAYGVVHWGAGEDFMGIPRLEVVGDPFGEDFMSLEQALAPLIEEAWELHRSVSAAGAGAVVPSMPILFFGDLQSYWWSPRRVITVGLNPSNQEFPADDPWGRFPGGETLAPDKLDDEARSAYLKELAGYFETHPYRKWFDRSFERLLRGLDASYYTDGASVALHTDIASPIATAPTWNSLEPWQRELHRAGADLWRRLVDLLAPDLIVLSVARPHLAAVSGLALAQWEELTRIERKHPFIVSATDTTVAAGRKQALVVHGRSTNITFGSIKLAESEWIGRQIAAHLDRFDHQAVTP
jgi:hypothetical protein